MSIPLFSGPYLSDALDTQAKKLGEYVANLSERDLPKESGEKLVDQLVSRFSIEPLKIDTAGISVKREEEEVVSSRRRRMDSGRQRTVPGIRLSFFVPFSGDPDLFEFSPREKVYDFPTAEVNNNKIILSYVGLASAVDSFKVSFERDLKTIQDKVNLLKDEVIAFNKSLTGIAKETITRRLKVLAANRQAAEQTGYPLRE